MVCLEQVKCPVKQAQSQANEERRKEKSIRGAVREKEERNDVRNKSYR